MTNSFNSCVPGVHVNGRQMIERGSAEQGSYSDGIVCEGARHPLLPFTHLYNSCPAANSQSTAMRVAAVVPLTSAIGVPAPTAS